LPAALPLHDRVDVPLPETAVGLTVHERLVELDATVRATEAENPFTGPTVTVETPAEPAIPVIAVGLALRLKS